MNIPFIHDKLPDGAWKARYEAEFYRLLPRKRQMYDGNYEVKEGLRYLIWSHYARKYYERTLNPLQDTEENIQYYVKQGVMYIWPTEDNKQEIREDVEREKLSYWKLMYRRNMELEFDRNKNNKHTGNGDKFWAKYRREQIDNLKVKYKKR